MKLKFYIYLSILLLVFIFTVLISYFFNKAIVINFNKDNKIDIKTKNNFLDSVKKAGLRDIEKGHYWFDDFFKKFYKKIDFKIIKKNDFIENNSIQIVPKYAAVDIINELNRIDKNNEESLYSSFLTNKELKIEFLETDKLNLNKRILLKKVNGEPVVFYEITVFEIYNLFNKRKYNLEKKINFVPVVFDKPLILGFAGDLVIEEYVKSAVDEYGFNYPFKDVNKILEVSDIMSANLEFSIADRGKKENKHFTFRAESEYARLIFDSAIDYFSLANNHAMDFGEVSLLDTLYYFNHNDKYYSGTGRNINEAFYPATIKIDDHILKYFSICEVNDEVRGYQLMKNFKADKQKPGVAFFDKNIITGLFNKCKKDNNLVITQFHTGNELSFELSADQIKKTRQLIDLGSDAVICHHPHYINGVEIYKNKLIFYSLGDFLFDIQKEFADEGIIIFLYVIKNKIVSWSFYPVVSHYGKVIIDENRISLVEKRFLELTKKRM